MHDDPDATPTSKRDDEERAGRWWTSEPAAADQPPERSERGYPRVDDDAGSASADTTEPLFAASRRPDDGEPSDSPGAARPAQDRSRRSATGSFFRELPVLLLIALLLAFLLRTFVLQVFFIPSGSMEPTLRVDDRMVVEKVTYLFREPERGEVVVFEGDTDDTAGQDASTGERLVRGIGQFVGIMPVNARDFVKRVIGLPGDEIVISDGAVSVNGELLDEPYVVFEDPSDFGPVTVPEGHLFFLGDNRPNSSDSRRSLGFVPAGAVVGRSAAVIWPLDNMRSLTGVEHQVPDAGDVEAPSQTPDSGA